MHTVTKNSCITDFALYSHIDMDESGVHNGHQQDAKRVLVIPESKFTAPLPRGVCCF
jgi:hypothetical protein